MNRKNRSIVVIDDESKIRDKIAGIIGTLEEKGFDLEVYNSSHGIEGLGLIYSLNPNIIILDLSLPRYNGREIVEFIETNPKYLKSEFQIIILNDGLSTRKFPSNFNVVEKSDPNFIEELSIFISFQ